MKSCHTMIPYLSQNSKSISKKLPHSQLRNELQPLRQYLCYALKNHWLTSDPDEYINKISLQVTLYKSRDLVKYKVSFIFQLLQQLKYDRFQADQINCHTQHELLPVHQILYPAKNYKYNPPADRKTAFLLLHLMFSMQDPLKILCYIFQ